MKLNVMGFIVAEGTETECAMYTYGVVELFRMKQESDKKKEVDEWLKKYGDKTFEELMRMERDGEE